MAYQIFLQDDINYVELDCETVDMKSVFSVADIRDLSARKDSVKSITFKGTKTNNNAFGIMFDLGHTTDEKIANNLFFNYNPLRAVLALVYEDNMLVFKGSLRVSEIAVSPLGDVIYSTVVTGGLIDFKNVLQDALLTDLDFSDFTHHYMENNMYWSWFDATERYDAATNTFPYIPFALGSGYVYPYIDYGYTFQTHIDTDGNNDVNEIHYSNFKPAIYVREYFNKIFSQPSLPGFSYEIKGDADFIERFNSLIIPGDDDIKQTYFGVTVTAGTDPALAYEENFAGDISPDHIQLYPNYRPVPPVGTPLTEWKLLNLGNIVTPSTISPFLEVLPFTPPFQPTTYYDVLAITKALSTSATFSVDFDFVQNIQTTPITVTAQLVTRPYENNEIPTSNWTVIAEDIKTIPAGSPSVPYNSGPLNFSGIAIERSYVVNDQLAVRIILTDMIKAAADHNVYYLVVDTLITFPKDGTSTISMQPVLEINDLITPKPPINIKQIDFLKGVINLFNMYAYTETINPKHIIFERYGDYYALAAPRNVVATALDWTKKIDYTGGWKVKSNISLPKAYTFTYKTDTDYVNDLYKKKYNKVYGQFDFNDNFGLVDTKKVELIFSPTPMISYVGSDRLHGALFTGELKAKKVSKTNIRILYYNGLKNCVRWKMLGEKLGLLTPGVWDKYGVADLTVYPLASNYYFDSSGVPIDDLNFAIPAEIYFTVIGDYYSATTAYDNYYKQQVSELTNFNVNYIECSVLLNEIDIANLDLKVPVYIDMGSHGHAYFKVLEVTYEDNNTPSTVQLQRIVI